MSYIQYVRHRVDVSLTDQAVQQMKQIVPNLVSQSNDKFQEMTKQLDEVSKKFNLLNDIVDEVASKFEKKAQTREANHPSEIMLLQAILDHSLSEEDIRLFHSYIDHLFRQILKDIQHADPKFNFIKSISMLHKLRAKDRELSQVYDRISKYCGINNNGSRRSHIYQLYKFHRDFDPNNEKKVGLPEANVSSFHFKPSQPLNLDENQDDFITGDKKYLEMPEYENLWDDDLVTYAMLKIRVSVQNRDLSGALQKCVRAVQRCKLLSQA